MEKRVNALDFSGMVKPDMACILPLCRTYRAAGR
jgi:hypothetical protein